MPASVTVTVVPFAASRPAPADPGTPRNGISTIPPSSAGWMFLVGGLASVALGLALSVALVVSGRAIAARRRHGFCLVTSFVATFFFPFGTLLGFHTIHALTAPAAQAAFGLERGAPFSTPPGPPNG